MMSAAKPRILVWFGLAGGALLLAGTVWAGGIPLNNTLTYSGALENPDGSPFNGDANIEVKFWRAGAASDAMADCTSNSQNLKITNGQFSVPLPKRCKDVISMQTDISVEVLVDGATFGRAPLSAVPYAVEAEHALNADGASGELKAALVDAQKRLAALENATKPSAIVDGFNAAVSDGAHVKLGDTQWQPEHDVRWIVQHGAAAASCAALGMQGDSPAGHVVIPQPTNVTCANACATNTSNFAKCKASIAIGQLLPGQAQAYTDVVATDYNYSCDEAQAGLDEVMGQGAGLAPGGYYSRYCCCLR